MGQVACETCRFWHKEDDHRFANECRRLPPAFAERRNGREIEIKRAWPLTSPIDWCGEYKTLEQMSEQRLVRRAA